MRVLVATDGSSASEAAVRFASSLLARVRDGELLLLTVETKRKGSKRFPSALPAGEGASTVHGVQVRRILARARVSDEVPEVICRQADRVGADLVVVGSEGRESLEAWVVGGTALRLLYLSRRPVTVVRAPLSRTARTARRA